MISPAGPTISTTVRIESVDHLSEALVNANSTDTAVLPRGGGTCLTTGRVVDHVFTGLDMSGMSGVIDYVPTDMTAGFLAGTPIREIREVLAANGQELPLDLAADDAGTIGGLVATGFSSARRLSQGTLKDLLIGCEYVRGDGLVAKAGGMTVKNVSGFEISRMLHGSWGALAVLTRVNLKVLPIARVDRTLTWQDGSVAEAIARQLRLLDQFPGATALQTTGMGSIWSTSIRFTGRNTSIDDYIVQASSMEGSPVTDSDSADVWVAPQSTASEPQLVVSGSVETLQSTISNLAASGLIVDVTWSFGTGSLRATLAEGTDLSVLPSMLPGSMWMFEGGTDAFRRTIPVWGPVRQDVDVMRSIKHQFDPGNVLNRGRLFF